ncbi:hypothetical protein, partial [Klebsiella pneumoniae]
AATNNQGTRLCSRANTQKIFDYLCGRRSSLPPPRRRRGITK